MSHIDFTDDLAEFSISKNVKEMKEEIMQRNQLFNQFVNEKNNTELSALYSEDALLYPPKQTVIKGKDAISDFFGAVFNQGINKGDFSTKEISIEGNLAYETGDYLLFAGNDQVVAQGHYLYVWKYINGIWYIHQDIWND
ncbi:Ketosteroid isomerase homolog [Pedobacter caeni]|uniref:Ketosteroid isomerase homolog n=2 Tax=Pedobacter caeni TaxID=288992 RepID=A0A1M4YYH9_9SPHI|nr:Ketosteroid isomerase homolog [Pedobacter caeni]